MIDNKHLAELVPKTKALPRRMNYNSHRSLDDKCHRMLNAIEPGTVMPIRVIEQQEFLNYLDDTYGEYIGIVALFKAQSNESVP